MVGSEFFPTSVLSSETRGQPYVSSWARHRFALHPCSLSLGLEGIFGCSIRIINHSFGRLLAMCVYKNHKYVTIILPISLPPPILAS